jgi:phosphate transport system substrate-binding protein
MKVTLLCLDGVAVVVNSANTVSNLTVAQIKDIFTGVVTDWSKVGGTGGKIHKFTRDAASGTREAFQNLMLGKDTAGKQIEIDEKLFDGVFDSTGAVASAVQGDPAGIGYMSLGIVPTYDGIKSVDADNIKATLDNMENGTYKYIRPFNLLTMDAPVGASADFINWCLTDDEAKAYLQEKGYLLP